MQLADVFRVTFLLLAGMTAAGAQPVGVAAQSSGSDIGLSWGVVSNMLDEGGRFESELIIENRASTELLSGDWTLYFNFGRMIDEASLPPSVTIEHVNGDFYALRPTEDFEPLAGGARRHITFAAGGSAILRSDQPEGFYLVREKEDGSKAIEWIGDPVVLPFTRREQLHRSTNDQFPLATPAYVYEQNADLSLLPEDEVPLVIPRPVRLNRSEGRYVLQLTDAIAFQEGLENEATALSVALEPVLGPRLHVQPDTTGEISLKLNPDAFEASEAYRLSVTSEGIVISGADRAGVFYGIQTLGGLIPPVEYGGPRDSVALPTVEIDDAPRFAYRGMHLDVARHFHPVEDVEKLLNLMALYKLNKFHVHLTDDEGWRLEIADLPELTEVGGRRGHTLTEEEHLVPSLGSGPFPDPEQSRGSGWYTRQEFVDLLRYARDRHIEVIPEIDMPGHALSAIRAMEARHDRLVDRGQIEAAREFLLTDLEDASEYRSVQMWEDNVVNACMESTYRFLEAVVEEIVSMYEEAGAPLTSIHIGGDEVPQGVWERSPACERLIATDGDLESTEDLFGYFVRRFDDILDRHGLVTAGWEEIGLVHEVVDGRPSISVNRQMAAEGLRPYVWNSVWGWGAEGNAYKLANAGYEVVLSNASNYYLDFAHQKHPEEIGFYWGGFVDLSGPFEFIPLDLYKTPEVDAMGRPIDASHYESYERLTEERRQRVLGIQGQLWSENIKSSERLEHMVFPRLLALAERAWAADPAWAAVEDRIQRRTAMRSDWNQFANALGRRELPRLDLLEGGVSYRIPPPGAVLRDAEVVANVALPGLTIRYTTDGSEPAADSPVYEGPISAEGNIMLRTFNTTGRGSRTVSVPSDLE